MGKDFTEINEIKDKLISNKSEIKEVNDFFIFFKYLKTEDVDHEYEIEDFLDLYNYGVKHYGKDFSDELEETLKNDPRYVVENKYIEIKEILDKDTEKNKSEKVIEGFEQLLNMEVSGNNYPIKSVFSLLLSANNNYQNIQEKLHDAIKNSPYTTQLTNLYTKHEIDKSKYSEKFGDFAEKLNSAKRWNDSNEYKELITELESLRDKPLSIISSNGTIEEEYKNLTNKQIEALPYLRVYNKIEQYLQHKAKDGVNRNAYDKLAVVEQLCEYVGKKIEDLNPGKFKFPDFQNKEKLIEYDPGMAHETYAKEYSTVKDALDKQIKNKSLFSDHGLKYTDKDKTPLYHFAYEYVNDTSLLNKAPKDPKGKNINDCLDRIMLRAQMQNLAKNIKKGEFTMTLHTVPSHLAKAKNEFISSWDNIRNEANARNRENGPTI